eukprot:CAMPEP_0203841776 /NCGR_PEP_ID=MMETSP0359-20131031/1601_1 /ASSEMBLY_ACC=CAM_ASM_000338 /TAXON_ID=268821 /ORGANISM="Scrippsiella Hangoei, Strain SHTV-5" /LENGTH=77 /DNA_ID=CAMNT_0050756259 /DNA_START=8 /DNA_END=237 /DNA_ORIENTATION=+
MPMLPTQGGTGQDMSAWPKLKLRTLLKLRQLPRTATTTRGGSNVGQPRDIACSNCARAPVSPPTWDLVRRAESRIET